MSMRNVIIIVAVIVLLASGSAYTVFSIIGAPWGGESPRPATKSSERNGPGPIYNAGTMTVNLSAHGVPSTRFVRAGVAFELDSEKARRQLEQREEQVKDKIISIVRQQTPESIATAEGERALKQQLGEAVNELLVDGLVRDVYFFDLVVQ